MPKGWRLPFKEEWEQFIEKTTHRQSRQKGISGTLFTDKENGNKIFLPASGYRQFNYNASFNKGLAGYYRSGTPRNEFDSYIMTFSPKHILQSIGYDYNHFSVRCITN